MKKLLSVLSVIVILLSINTAAFAKAPLVIDDANVLSSSEYSELLSYADNLSSKYGIETVIYFTDHVSTNNLGQYCDDIRIRNSYSDNLSIFFVAIRDGMYYFYNSGTASKAITDYGSEYIDNMVVPYLSKGNFYQSAASYLRLSDEFYNQYFSTGNAYDIDNSPNALKMLIIKVLGSTGVGLLLAGIPLRSQKKKMQTVKAKYGASDYADYKKFRLNIKNDKFITRNITKIPIPRSTPSSPGGGSHGGTTFHTSSSGHSYSGHGGRF